MKKLLIVLIVLMCAYTLKSENYKKVKIFLNQPNDITNLISLGLGIDHASLDKDLSLTVFLSDTEFTRLKNSGYQYDVIIDDWYQYYANLPMMTEEEKESQLRENETLYGIDGFEFGSMGGYLTFQEIVETLDTMYAQYPNLITEKFSIGTSHEGRTIWAVKISDNPNIAENEPAAMFDALIHAREGASNSTLVFYMWYLLENYGTDPEVTYLVDNREIYFVPCFNPDGYEYNHQTNPNGGGMWRKNRRNNGGSFGVDLNRNFGYQWGFNNVGSSPNPSDDTYRGPNAFSEPETQAVRDFVIGKNIKTYINYHTYSNVIIYPWGYINQLTPDSTTYKEFASDMSQWNGYAYGTGTQTLGYPSNGNARDWFYGEQTVKNKIFGYVFEVGSSSDGFWAPQSRIIPLAQENLQPNLYNTWVAGEYVSFVGAEYNISYFNPGDNVEMTATMKNKGLKTAFNLNVDLSSLSSFIIVTGGTMSIDSIPSSASVLLSNPFTFSVSGSASIGEEYKLLVTTSMSGITMSEDTVRIVIGTPVFVFEDNEDDPNILWNITSTPTNPKWDATTTAYYSSPTSYTDSKNGQYANNATVRLIMKDPVDLTDVELPKLSFWTKYEIENEWDCGQVEISTNNGSAWTPLEGNYTTVGSGNGAQPNGEPLYDGTQSEWVHEEIDLSPYIGNQIKIRFELLTDTFLQRDGWYLDNISIYYYGAIPVELISFNANVNENSVKLRWSTATEINNAGFEIERTTPHPPPSRRGGQAQGGGDGWEKIGSVVGHGTTTEPQKYGFTDNTVTGGTYYYRLKQVDFNGTFEYSITIEINFAPIEFALEQNYPNPFNPSTTINYSIVKPGLVSLKIYNLLGEEVGNLVNEVQEAGNHSIEFSSEQSNKELTSGVYFYSLKSGDFFETKKMLLLK